MQENKFNEFLESALKKNPHLNPLMVEDWLESVIKLSEDTIDFQDNYRSNEHRTQMIERGVSWHISKLNGFVGGDMAALAMEFNGDFYPFGTAEDVIKQKICLVAPEALYGDGERRMVMLPTVKKKFLKEMAAYELKPYDLAYEKIEELEKAGGIASLPWLKSKPDSIYIDKNNEVWLVAFKVPAEHDTVISAYEDPGLYYKAPLAQDKIFLEQAGIKVHHTAIVPFSTKEMKVYVSEFPVNLELEKLVVDAGNQYWDFVLKNEMPKRPPGKNFSYIKEVPLAFQKLISEFVVTKKLASISKEKSDKLKDRLLEMAKTIGVDWEQMGLKTRLPGLDISHKESSYYNTKRLKDAFRLLGGNPDAPEFTDDKTQTTVAVIRSAKTDHSLMIGEIQEIAIRCFDDAIADTLEHMDIDPKVLPAPIDPTLFAPEPITQSDIDKIAETLKDSSKVLSRPRGEIQDIPF